MDLLDRARTLAACPLFEALAPAVVVRLAERGRVREVAPGETCSSEEHVWIVASGALAVTAHGAVDALASIGTRRARGTAAEAGGALGMIRVVSPATPPVSAYATEPTVLVGLTLDDVRDVLEEDPTALAALAEAVAALLLREAGSP